MSYQTIANYSPNTTAEIFAYAASVTNTLFPLILFGLCLVATIGSYIIEKRRVINASLTTSLVAGSTITLLLAFLFSLLPNVINGITLGITFAWWVVTLLILFLGKTD